MSTPLFSMSVPLKVLFEYIKIVKSLLKLVFSLKIKIIIWSWSSIYSQQENDFSNGEVMSIFVIEKNREGLGRESWVSHFAIFLTSQGIHSSKIDFLDISHIHCSKSEWGNFFVGSFFMSEGHFCFESYLFLFVLFR